MIIEILYLLQFFKNLYERFYFDIIKSQFIYLLLLLLIFIGNSKFLKIHSKIENLNLENLQLNIIEKKLIFLL